MSEKMFEDVYKEIFPFWEKISAKDRNYICQNSYVVNYPRGKNIHDGSKCSGVILVRSGSLRLYMMSDTGKDITLYRLHQVISGPAFAAVSQRNPDIKIFAQEAVINRFADVMWVMQQILFMSIDKRLAIFLLDEATRTGSDTILMTHGQIARYMGSAREVISRMLKYFAGEGLVEVSRGGVTILNKNRLRELAV